MMNKVFYVYVILCSDGSFHTAVTENLERSIREHNTGGDAADYAYARRPVRLLYHALFHDREKALEFKEHLTSWPADKLQDLICGRWNDPVILSTCRNASGHKFYGVK
jgi:putative endonuclease